MYYFPPHGVGYLTLSLVEAWWNVNESPLLLNGFVARSIVSRVPFASLRRASGRAFVCVSSKAVGEVDLSGPVCWAWHPALILLFTLVFRYALASVDGLVLDHSHEHLSYPRCST